MDLKKVTTTPLEFNPIQVSISFDITTLDEYLEILEYYNTAGAVTDAEGDPLTTLTDLMYKLTKEIVSKNE